MTTPEPTRPADEHTDAVALDLDGVVAHRDNLAAMIRRLSDFLDGRGLNSWKHGACWAAEDAIKSLTARAEKAEAENARLVDRIERLSAEYEADLPESMAGDERLRRVFDDHANDVLGLLSDEDEGGE